MILPLLEVVNPDERQCRSASYHRAAARLGRPIAGQVEWLFHKHLYAAATRYYLELRINGGRRLLPHSALSVPEMAVAGSFTSVTQCSKRYLAYFSYPPSDERQLNY
ncbi:hypothetical protein [Pseudomonas sp. EpS/L25]|uniref:hypothetical protein n=1 Tax=Pseudomonas sp. EpS/L25 TaxID=1749078 RepID=UPI000B19C70F